MIITTPNKSSEQFHSPRTWRNVVVIPIMKFVWTRHVSTHAQVLCLKHHSDPSAKNCQISNIRGTKSQNLNAVFTKIIGHVGHFRWLGPNVRWEISRIWIEYIKPIGQMSDESWKFFGYTGMFLVSPCSCLCPIHWSHVFYIWVIGKFIAY